MNTPDAETILTALRDVFDEDARTDVVSAGMISGLTIRGDKVGFLITIAPQDGARKAHLREACESAVRRVAGVAAVTAVLTAQNAEPIAPTPGGPYAQPRERAVWNLTPVEGVARIVAVASGKGGVGKSTVTVNLALAMAQRGLRVGVLDADIYGPSVPRMLGLAEAGHPPTEGGKMLPPSAYGVACMSMQFITGDQAAILRGPMISKSLHQLLRATRWDNLDMLLVDMPPGTGDIHLSLAQQAPLAGAVIVTTPQEVALMDARKCAQMFVKLGVPLLGVVENMSGPVFGEGGGARLATEFGVPLLARIALDAAIREAGDAGSGAASELFAGVSLGV